jgi:WD40 repeat protein
MFSLAFSRDGKTLVSGGLQGAVTRWDTASAAPIGKPLKTDDGVALTLGGFGSKAAFFAEDGTVAVWDVARRRRVADGLRVGEGASIALSPDGDTLASAGLDRAVRLWSVGGPVSFSEPLHGVPRSVSDIAFAPDSKSLAAGGDGGVRLWDVARRERVGGPFSRNDLAIAFSPDGTLASGGSGPLVKLWDVVDRRLRPIGEPLRGHKGAILSLGFSSDGKTLWSASSDNTLRFWQVGERAAPMGEPLRIEDGEFSVVSPAADVVATGGEDGTIRILDVGRRAPRGRAFRDHRVAALAAGSRIVGVNTLAFSPDGGMLASGGADDLVRLWDVERHTSLGALAGHEYVLSVAFTPDGHVLVSAGLDGTVRFWDVARREPLGEPFRSPGVDQMAFSPDGRTFATISSGERVPTTIAIWDVVASPEFEDWQRRLCPLVGRNLTKAEWRQFGPEPRRRTCPQYP